jgi:hypothetical protein
MYALIWELDFLISDSCIMSLAVFTYISTHDGNQIWDHLNENTM